MDVSMKRLVMLLIFLQAARIGADEPRLGTPQVDTARFLLRQDQPLYRSFAVKPFTNYPNHTAPYEDTPRAYYNVLGNQLITGYDVYEWLEHRSPGMEYGSSIFKDLSVFRSLFRWVLVARDGHQDWAYSAIVGDGMIARFTPLTLSKVDFNGLRLDLTLPHLQFTALGSRIARPNHTFGTNRPVWAFGETHVADPSTLLLGSRLQIDAGPLRLGLNGVNAHVYQSTQPGNSLKGVVHPKQPLVGWVVVRFADDSPEDGRAGATVQNVTLVLDDERRPDLKPIVVRHRAAVPVQVGSISRLTGEFNPVLYNTFTAYYQSAPYFYRGRTEVPLYADYLYRFDHEAGVDVSGDTHLPGLLANFALESADEALRADGDEQLAFLFDLTAESHVESVEVEAVLGNDYRVDVATLFERNARGRNYGAQFQSSFYRMALRAPGNVRDLSNLKRVRFKVGEETAIFTYSADMSLQLPGLEIRGEYARSAVYSRYPAHVQGEKVFGRAPRFANRGGAHFLHATRLGRGRLGAEYFAMRPEFRTSMQAYLPFEAAYADTPLGGLVNETIYWDLVQDNEDGDRFPDFTIGEILGTQSFRAIIDPDGVFPGLDEDNDGFPDTNYNRNGTPDYDEPFLMYWVEPDEYVYGLDRNNNDVTDEREDDMDFDYPYDPDQRGYHLFGQLDLNRYWSAGAGHYRVGEIAGAGHNDATYALLSYRREGLGRLKRLVFENNLRRVRDDIADEYIGTNARWWRPFTIRDDVLFYRDSFVDEAYLEGWFNPWSTLNVAHRMRVRINWQQGGRLRNGFYQRPRRLDFWAWTSRADYTWHWGSLQLRPQFKFLTLRLKDHAADRLLRSEYWVIPILRLSCPLLRRSILQAGVQGFGPAPYRVVVRTDGSSSFEQRTAFFTLTNRSRYFGYELYTILGIKRDHREFDNVFQRVRDRNEWTGFVRAMIGFTEYGRPY